MTSLKTREDDVALRPRPSGINGPPALLSTSMRVSGDGQGTRVCWLLDGKQAMSPAGQAVIGGCGRRPRERVRGAGNPVRRGRCTCGRTSAAGTLVIAGALLAVLSSSACSGGKSGAASGGAGGQVSAPGSGGHAGATGGTVGSSGGAASGGTASGGTESAGAGGGAAVG